MRRLLTATEAKALDRYTIGQIGVPSVVLMERASLAVAGVCEELLCEVVAKEPDRKHILNRRTQMRILCVCAMGNNGADGVTVAHQADKALGKVGVVGHSPHRGTVAQRNDFLFLHDALDQAVLHGLQIGRDHHHAQDASRSSRRYDPVQGGICQGSRAERNGSGCDDRFC